MTLIQPLVTVFASSRPFISCDGSSSELKMKWSTCTSSTILKKKKWNSYSFRAGIWRLGKFCSAERWNYKRGPLILLTLLAWEVLHFIFSSFLFDVVQREFKNVKIDGDWSWQLQAVVLYHLPSYRVQQHGLPPDVEAGGEIPSSGGLGSTSKTSLFLKGGVGDDCPCVEISLTRATFLLRSHFFPFLCLVVLEVTNWLFLVDLLWGNYADRAEVEKMSKTAQELWLACAALKQRLKISELTGGSWNDRIKPLMDEIDAIEMSASKYMLCLYAYTCQVQDPSSGSPFLTCNFPLVPRKVLSLDYR